MSTPISAPQWSARQGSAMISVAAAAAFLATFNETFLNVALNEIMAAFTVSVGTVQWLATGYLLVAAMFVPVSNVLYRRFNTRPLFVSVVLLLVVGSIVGAVAPTFAVLLAGRLLQAIGTGLLVPIGMNVALAVAPRHKLGLVMGIMAAMTTLGPSTAIVASGVLLTIAPWSTLMWVFGALAALVMLAGALFLRRVVTPSRPRLDVLSFALIAAGLAGVLYGISTVFAGSVATALIALFVGAVALVLFVMRQKRIVNPLIDLAPFASKTYVLGVVMTMLGLLFVFAMNVVIPIFLQAAKDITPLGAALTLAPGILLTVAMGPIAGRMYDRRGGRVMIATGYLVMAVFSLLVAWVAAGPSALWIGVLYVPAVLGTAFVIGPAQTFALAQLDRETAPHGVTILSTSFQIAGCVGTSLGVGTYAALEQAAVGAGSGVADAAVVGFCGVAVLVAVTSVVGALISARATRTGSRD